MKTKTATHTPTPFQVVNDVSIYNGRDEFVCRIEGGREYAKANATFIKTAVSTHQELVEALRDIQNNPQFKSKTLALMAKQALAKAQKGIK